MYTTYLSHDMLQTPVPQIKHTHLHVTGRHKSLVNCTANSLRWVVRCLVAFHGFPYSHCRDQSGIMCALVACWWLLTTYHVLYLFVS